MYDQFVIVIIFFQFKLYNHLFIKSFILIANLSESSYFLTIICFVTHIWFLNFMFSIILLKRLIFYYLQLTISYNKSIKKLTII